MLRKLVLNPDVLNDISARSFAYNVLVALGVLPPGCFHPLQLK